MTLPTRLAFWAASWVLYLSALLWRLGRALERPDDEEASWSLIGGLWAVLAGYVVVRAVWAVTDTAWDHGFRR